MRRWIPWVLLAALIAAATRPLWWLSPPYFVLDDGFGHLFRVFEFDRVIRQGVLYPRWAPDLAYGYGYPVFNYYAPLIYYIAEAFHLFGLAIADSIKMLMAATVAIAAFGAYAMGRVVGIAPSPPDGATLTRRPTVAPNRRPVGGSAPEPQSHSSPPNGIRPRDLAGVLTAFAYVLFPYFLLNLYTRGAIGDALAAALLPWLVWALLRVLRSDGVAPVMLAALFAALLILAHNLTALAAAAFVGLYVLWELTRLAPARRLATCARLVAAGVLALFLTAIYWIPLVSEVSLVAISREGADLKTILGLNFLTPGNLVQGSWLYQYAPGPFPLALTPMLLAALGLAAALAARRGAPVFFGAAAFVSAFLLTDISKPIWLHAPLLSSIQFPWRLSVLVGLGTAVSIGSLVWTVPSTRWFRSLTARASARLTSLSSGNSSAVQWAVVMCLAGLLAWSGLANLAARPVNDLHGPTSLAQLVRFETDFTPVGIGDMSEYLPVTVRALPQRVSQDAAVAAVPKIDLTEYSATRREFSASASAPISISLHAFYFPDWRASIDGQPAEAYPTRQMGVYTLDVPAGSHHVSILLVDTTPRSLGALVSVIGLFVLAFLTVYIVRRRERDALAVLAVLALALAVFSPIALAAASAAPPALQSTQVAVSPALNLIGVSIDGARQSAGLWQIDVAETALNMTVYWQVEAPVSGDPISWRLVDTEGKVWSSRAECPRYGAGLPATWFAGEIVPDHYDLDLPASMPPGRYVVQVAGSADGNFATAASIQLDRAAETAAPETQIAHQNGSRVGDAVQLVGYDAPEPPRPGQSFPIVSYWKTDRPIPVDYTAFVQMLDAHGGVAAHHDGLTGERFDPTTLWAPGGVQSDRHDLSLPATVAPGIYRLVAGLYQSEDVTRLPVVDAAGRASPDDVVELGEVKIPMNAQSARPQHALDVAFGPSIRLAGYDVETAQGTARFKLYWKANADVRVDYKVFVHIADANGNLTAQVDRLPMDGEYPTRIWDAGEQVIDAYSLPMEHLPAGAYSIVAGMYAPDTGVRLHAVDASGRELPGDQVQVGSFDWTP